MGNTKSKYPIAGILKMINSGKDATSPDNEGSQVSLTLGEEEIPIKKILEEIMANMGSVKKNTHKDFRELMETWEKNFKLRRSLLQLATPEGGPTLLTYAILKYATYSVLAYYDEIQQSLEGQCETSHPVFLRIRCYIVACLYNLSFFMVLLKEKEKKKTGLFKKLTTLLTGKKTKPKPKAGVSGLVVRGAIGVVKNLDVFEKKEYANLWEAMHDRIGLSKYNSLDQEQTRTPAHNIRLLKEMIEDHISAEVDSMNTLFESTNFVLRFKNILKKNKDISDVIQTESQPPTSLQDELLEDIEIYNTIEMWSSGAREIRDGLLGIRGKKGIKGLQHRLNADNLLPCMFNFQHDVLLTKLMRYMENYKEPTDPNLKSNVVLDFRGMIINRNAINFELVVTQLGKKFALPHEAKNIRTKSQLYAILEYFTYNKRKIEYEV